jgi:hypothetical protein
MHNSLLSNTCILNYATSIKGHKLRKGKVMFTKAPQILTEKRNNSIRKKMDPQKEKIMRKNHKTSFENNFKKRIIISQQNEKRKEKNQNIF